MSETFILRDHSQPCEHGLYQYCNQPSTNLNPRGRVLCPGGRERTFVHPVPGEAIFDEVWVEATDE